MLKAKEYKAEDSNIALLGSDLDKKAREAAAKTEKAWEGAGKKVGLEIWRIEKFHVVPWPKDQYGSFFSGDSYILLNTYKKPESDALLFDVHFWLGATTSQDEMGTAAYKTVELDDLLGGAPIQHREVQGHESDLFMKYFNNNIRLMEGGVESGFRHVEPEKYRPRLLHIKGKKKVRVTEVELSGASLNSGDVFVLDNGLELFQWNGKSAGIFEKNKGATLSRAISDERAGKAKVQITEEGTEPAEFWKLLGGKPAKIKTAEEGGSDEEAEKVQTKKLFHLSDATGSMVFKEIAAGPAIKRNMLKSEDVFILDVGSEVFAWIGKGASAAERKNAMQYASDYLKKNNRPPYIPIARVLEGGENEVFEAHFVTAH
jgi:gelsolin